jgi:hypothetical protein
VPRHFKRKRDGTYEVRLDEGLRDVLQWLLPQVKEVIVDEGDLSRRLFPTAHPQSPELESEYREIAHDDLKSSRLAAFDVIEESIDSKRLEPEQMEAWLRAVNDIRLVLGTRLDLSEETDLADFDPDQPEYGLYWGYSILSELLWEMVEAME